ncbi:MarP family serine protease [Homoserinibacter sp. YIM 151385]|uniref:MarP family serine protease n=1 Tax=Homoserinibacter sp. YIM 151385 TaxID=2985506 RepID=UPI0022F0E9EB|nr:MarP family serine protease [Homoserinibacter sp. YIM 151385]WBU38396.1 MarP family serine protease [Homoserinibacter sp. YIM 151385]
MLIAIVLDIALVLVLLSYLVIGWKGGFARTLAVIVGLLLGAALAFLAIPIVVAIVPAPEWRGVAALGLAIGLLAGGHAVGDLVGSSVRGAVRAKPLAAIDRLLGALLSLVAVALTSSLVLGSVGAIGMPLLSNAVAGSGVLRTIERLTPDPVDGALARIRAAVLDDGLPSIADALGGVSRSPGAPTLEGTGPGFEAAAASVVRVGGTAYACGQNQTGSGFVVAPDRVVTNAHVVAGVERPVVERRDGGAVEGRVVLFDAETDLAVIATDGLGLPAIALAATPARGDRGAVLGYPYGGPFTVGGAEVLAVTSERVDDIYGARGTRREVATLAAVVEPGNSGGPLLTLEGEVAGVVFAESSADPELGYAMTDAELGPVAAAAAGLSRPVVSGRCTRG